ncbi:hypothetical protein [Microbacterium candidum]|uniref:Uncharacterized protein n=1 Tax=Microbacterium candidum TaxID=3041922 RepID=A0ABT7MWS9_9MICO|nr:hypothetical protein [Microbacterium sp. ASV49]MDL9978910.1 hypothetical protein [Microbacterium sp. ASV49]
MFELYGVDVRFHQESTFRDQEMHITEVRAQRLVPEIVRRMHTCAGRVRSALRASNGSWARPIGISSGRARRAVAG